MHSDTAPRYPCIELGWLALLLERTLVFLNFYRADSINRWTRGTPRPHGETGSNPPRKLRATGNFDIVSTDEFYRHLKHPEP